MNVAVIHAHPDDEILWAGALMLSRPEWRWHLFSLTDGLRVLAYARLTDALAKRGVRATTHNLGNADAPEFDAAEWDADVAALNVFALDLVVTHGGGGEYGHPHHIAVHESVHRHFRHGWDFARSGGTVVQATADKAALFREVYGKPVYDELRADKPALIDGLFAVEHFRAWGEGA